VRTAAGRAILIHVDRPIAQVHLDIECGSDPIRGRISEAGARGRSFSGWIELVQEIEDARLGTPAGGEVSNNGGGERLGSLPGAKAPGGP